MQKSPPEEHTAESTIESENVSTNETLGNSTPLRIADLSIKSKTFIEYNYNGHKIIYRRVKKTNELVIDNYVYGEYVAWAEFSHTLTAILDGYTYTVGYDARMSKTFLNINDISIIEKTRWI